MGGGEQDSSQEQSSSSTFDPNQSANYQNLLDRADQWLSQGGIMQGQDFSGQMQGILNTNQAFYQEMMNGQVNQEALNNAMAVNASQLQQNFNRNVMPSIGSASQMTGTSGSSRRGIAEGLAASDMNQQIANANSQMIWQAEQDNMNRKMAGAQGMAGLMGQYQQLGAYQQAQKNSYLESLLAYKNLISGDFGGTETSTGTQVVEAG